MAAALSRRKKLKKNLVEFNRLFYMIILFVSNNKEINLNSFKEIRQRFKNNSLVLSLSFVKI